MAILKIAFTELATPPAGGYWAEYRVLGSNSDYIIDPGNLGSPIEINVANGYTSYEGSIWASCGQGSQSARIPYTFHYVPPAVGPVSCVSVSESEESRSPTTCHDGTMSPDDPNNPSVVPEDVINRLSFTIPQAYYQNIVLTLTFTKVNCDGVSSTLTQAVTIPSGALTASIRYNAAQNGTCASANGACRTVTESFDGFTQSPGC